LPASGIPAALDRPLPASTAYTPGDACRDVASATRGFTPAVGVDTAAVKLSTSATANRPVSVVRVLLHGLRQMQKVPVIEVLGELAHHLLD